MKQFVENRIKFLLLPLVIIAVGVIMYFVHGGFNFDIEFMGGIRMDCLLYTSPSPRDA